MARLYRSADPDLEPEPGAEPVPFRGRIRPGMVVEYTPSPSVAFLASAGGGGGGSGSSTRCFALVLCPASAVGERVRDIVGDQVNPPAGVNAQGSGGGGGDGDDAGAAERYLCAVILPSLLPGSYSLGIWQQVVVDVRDMVAEVLMEYDEATRYYYLIV